MDASDPSFQGFQLLLSLRGCFKKLISIPGRKGSEGEVRIDGHLGGALRIQLTWWFPRNFVDPCVLCDTSGRGNRVWFGSFPNFKAIFWPSAVESHDLQDSIGPLGGSQLPGLFGLILSHWDRSGWIPFRPSWLGFLPYAPVRHHDPHRQVVRMHDPHLNTLALGMDLTGGRRVGNFQGNRYRPGLLDGMPVFCQKKDDLRKKKNEFRWKR